LKLSNRIIVVIDEGKERLISMNVPAERISIVSNTVDLETFTMPESEPQNIKNYFAGDKKIILYTGTLSSERGLKTPILAMKLLITKIDNLMLLIVGDGPQKQELKTIVKTNQLEDCVRFMDWVDHSELAFIVNKAEVCIIPQPNNEFINTTIPHKLFEYMAIGKPVLVSDALPLKRIINETGAGLVFKSDDEVDFALRIEQLLMEEKDWEIKGQEAVRKIYNWKNDEKTLINMYNKLN
jgi:glycosyltransferase involved in cell wall biosynthesis